MRMSRIAPLALALVLALPVPAMASHMSQYRYTPTSHDDLGRSDEPNFAGATGLLGPAVSDRVIDANRDGLAEGYAVGAPAAPGCTDDAGREPSGLCGLWSVGLGEYTAKQVVPYHTAGTQGMSGNAAPGRFTPTKQDTVRLLDGRVDMDLAPAGGTGGAVYFDANHAFSDSPAGGVLAAAGAGPTILPGGSGIWAWYGDWTDKNGNGVIDELESPDPQDPGGVDASNEFVWYGNCVGYQGAPPLDGQAYCVDDPVPGTTLPVWIVPGNHHGYCNGVLVVQYCGSTNPLSWGDVPGRQAVCLVNIVAGQALPFICPTEVRDTEDFDAELASFGDPLLDDPSRVSADGTMDPRPADPDIAARQYVYGLGWQTEFYDASLVTTTTVITAVTHQSAVDKGLATWYDLRQASFTDVDRSTTWSPLAESLFDGTAKPAVRSQWVFARDTAQPAASTEDALLNSRLLNDLCDDSYLGVCPLGPVDSLLPPGTVPDTTHGLTSGNPGLGREPNTRFDIAPGAVYNAYPPGTTPGLAPGQEELLGYLNDYRGFASAYHAWVDINPLHGTLYNMAWTIGGACILCGTGGALGEPDILGQGAFTPPGDNNTVLQPGTYLFGGPMAAWKDRAQQHHEVVLDLPGDPLGQRSFDYAVPADSWPGDLVNSTGAFRDRGYSPETCDIRGVAATREWIACHQGAAEDFQKDFANGGEAVQVQEQAQQYVLRITPGALEPGPSDCWTVPVIVWRHLDRWEVADDTAIEDFQGACGADAVIRLENLGQGGDTNACCGSNDELILPEGNHGVVVYTSLSGTVRFQPPTENGVTPPEASEFVRDVDVFAPWGGALP
ncbi:MAG: hypothetical protein LC624_09055 [Halobacteriales archaeon]|nr:hypothetical protein [Halobacteriales archaeon]